MDKRTSAELLAEYIEGVCDFNIPQPPRYGSLSVCIIDCVYSLRTRYDEVTIPIVERYAKEYLNSDKYAKDERISDLISHIEKDGLEKFAKILGNNQKLGRNCVAKENVVLQLAQYLKAVNIETIGDFMAFEYPTLLGAVITSVDGISDAGKNYLFMLAGDSNRVKQDVHINQCLRDALGKENVGDEECQKLFSEATHILNNRHKDLTASRLDYIVWSFYHNI